MANIICLPKNTNKDRDRYYVLPESIKLIKCEDSEKAGNCAGCQLTLSIHPQLLDWGSLDGDAPPTWFKICREKLNEIHKQFNLKGCLIQNGESFDHKKFLEKQTLMNMDTFRIRFRAGDSKDSSTILGFSTDPFILLERQNVNLKDIKIFLIEHLLPDGIWEKWNIPEARPIKEKIPKPEKTVKMVPMETFRIHWRSRDIFKETGTIEGLSVEPNLLMQREGIDPVKVDIVLIEHRMPGDKDVWEKWTPPGGKPEKEKPAPKDNGIAQKEKIEEPGAETKPAPVPSGEMIPGGRFFPNATIQEEKLDPKIGEKFRTKVLILNEKGRGSEVSADLEWYRETEKGWWAKFAADPHVIY